MKRPFTNTVLLLCLLISGLAIMSGCRPGKIETPSETRETNLLKLNPGQYPEFKDGFRLEGLSASIDQSLVYFKRVPENREYRYGDERFTAEHMIRSLETFKAFLNMNPSAGDLNDFIRSAFFVYEAGGDDKRQVLFTGYFEPTYEGSLEKNRDCPWPLYGVPDDLLEIDLSVFSEKYKSEKRLVGRVDDAKKRVVPYYSRKEINAEPDFILRSTPVAWLKNRVDRFFLEIQGSGRIELDDDRVMRVHYAGSNGNAYRSVGRYLIEKNEIPKEQMSMQAIQTWLMLHPERTDEVLHYNDSFVFFKEEQGGPYGSLGVEITALRSIATDSRIFPKGGLCFVTTRVPDRININPLKTWEDASFFVLNQDTGGAIKGPARADIFFGNSLYARFAAGHMNTRGKLYFLVLNPKSL